MPVNSAQPVRRVARAQRFCRCTFAHIAVIEDFDPDQISEPRFGLFVLGEASCAGWLKSDKAICTMVLTKHSVDIEMKAYDISKAGTAVSVKIHVRGVLLGTVEIGQGTFGWKGAKRRHFKRISWGRLAAHFDNL